MTWLMHKEHGFHNASGAEEAEMRKNGWVDDTVRFNPDGSFKPKKDAKQDPDVYPEPPQENPVVEPTAPEEKPKQTRAPRKPRTAKAK